MQAKACTDGTSYILNPRLKIQAICSDYSYFMRCRNNLPYITDTYRLTYLVSMIPGKFQPTGSYNHADKSEQLPKIEPLRLRSLHFKGLTLATGYQ